MPSDFPLAFLGTPDFALPSLRALVDAGLTPDLVLTQPSKRRSRRGQPEPSPVGALAAELGLAWLETDDVGSGEAFERITTLKPKAIAVVAFGQLLRKHVLGLPEHGCINLHPSMLPRLRGAAPVQWAILNGEYQTGISIMRLVRKMDAGPILLQRPFELTLMESAEEALERTAIAGAAMLVEVLTRLRRGEEVVARTQDEAGVTFAPMLTREHGQIRFDQPAQRVFDQIRGVQPWPKAECWHHVVGKPAHRILIHGAEVRGELRREVAHGAVLSCDESGVVVACRESALVLTELQVEGKPRRIASEFLKGYTIASGDRFTPTA